MTRAPLRLGLVGAGAISQSYVQALRGSETARIAAIADVRPQAAKALAESIGCEAY